MIPFNYHHLYYFYIVAAEGSVTGATKILKLAQPTLSTQLKQFEEYLGFQLFIREGKKLVITEEGRNILSYAKAIFDLGNEMMDRLDDSSKTGYIKIQIGVANWVPKSIVDYALNSIIKTSPKTHISITERTLPEMIEALDIHKLDMIINDFPHYSATEDGIENNLLVKIPIVFCGSKKFAKIIKRFPKDLDGLPMYLPTSQSQTYHALKEYMISHNVKANILGEIQDIELVRRLVVNGHGIAPLNKFSVLNAPAHEKLQILGAKHTTGLYESIYVITKKRKHPHPLIKNIMASFQTITS